MTCSARAQARQEHTATALQQVGYDIAGLQFQSQCRCDQVVGHIEQLPRQGRQLFHRQAAMPVIHCLGQRVADAGADPDQGCLLDPDLGGVRNPIPRMSLACRYGFSLITRTASLP